MTHLLTRRSIQVQNAWLVGTSSNVWPIRGSLKPAELDTVFDNLPRVSFAPGRKLQSL